MKKAFMFRNPRNNLVPNFLGIKPDAIGIGGFFGVVFDAVGRPRLDCFLRGFVFRPSRLFYGWSRLDRIAIA